MLFMPYKDIEEKRRYQLEWRRKKNRRDRDKVFELLGGKCKHCGIDDYDVLQIDHIKPLRRKDHKGNTGTALKQAILLGKISLKKLQLLCANCHQKKTYKERILI